MPPSLIYGLMVALTLALSWSSMSHVLQKLALTLLGAWAASNLAVNLVGFEKAPLLIPSIDAVAALIVAILGYQRRVIIALVVFAIYATVAAVHVGAFVFGMQETYTYYLTLNLLFLAQLLLVGGSSAWLAVRRRAAGRDQRSGAHSSRRAHPG